MRAATSPAPRSRSTAAQHCSRATYASGLVPASQRLTAASAARVASAADDATPWRAALGASPGRQTVNPSRCRWATAPRSDDIARRRDRRRRPRTMLRLLGATAGTSPPASTIRRRGSVAIKTCRLVTLADQHPSHDAEACCPLLLTDLSPRVQMYDRLGGLCRNHLRDEAAMTCHRILLEA